MILSQRISPTQLETEDQFNRLLNFLTRHRSAADEISLFEVHCHHAYYPLDEMAERATLLERRIRQFRDAGFSSVGINVRDTLGHLNEGWDFCESLPFAAMIGHDGSVSKSCPCPNTAEFRSYIKEKYRLLAKAKPDFIWVDDDMRLHHHGVDFGCFCRLCIDRFGQGVVEREELAARLNTPDEADIRAAWIEHNATVIEEILKDISGAVHEINAEIDVGLMTNEPSWNTYSGFAFDRWFRALGGRRARPGGGFWLDVQPKEVLHKAVGVAMQCDWYPSFADNIQYELESIPYQKLTKSVASALNECTLALISGCTGVAFNVLREMPGRFDDYDDLLSAVIDERPALEALAEAAEGLPMVGMWPAVHNRLMGRRRLDKGDWFAQDADYDVSAPYVFGEIGVPLTGDKDAAAVVVLSGGIAEAFTDDELRAFLTKGVFLDGRALEALWERGLGDLTGVKIARTYDNGVWERMTGDLLNGPYADHGRDARINLWPSLAYRLEPVLDGTEDLAHLVGLDGSDCGMCVAAVENELGGRVATFGYAPYFAIHSSAKRHQVLALADWAAGGNLPVVIDQAVRVAPLVRMSPDGRRFAAVFLNMGFDAVGPLNVRFRANPGSVARITPDGRQPLDTRVDGRDTCVVVPGLDPWRTCVLVGG